MHYHMEIIMPNSRDISKSVDEMMKGFSEHLTDEEEKTGPSFWDWYVIGGRWAGTKETCRYDAEKLEQFYKELKENKITVSSVQCGKQQLSPEEQIPVVDKMWNDLFPTEDGTITPCPLFAHSNNQYDSNDLLGCGVCTFDEIPEGLKCSRVMICGPTHDNSGIEPTFMLADDAWNGVNHMPVAWDGTIKEALAMHMERMKNYSDEYREEHTPKPDWICITVDYHS